MLPHFLPLPLFLSSDCPFVAKPMTLSPKETIDRNVGSSTIISNLINNCQERERTQRPRATLKAHQRRRMDGNTHNLGSNEGHFQTGFLISPGAFCRAGGSLTWNDPLLPPPLPQSPARPPSPSLPEEPGQLRWEETGGGGGDEMTSRLRHKSHQNMAGGH